MKFEVADSFLADFTKLKREHRGASMSCAEHPG